MTGTTSVTQVTIGFQAGGEAFSQIIFFQDKRAYEEFINGSFEFGAQAQALCMQTEDFKRAFEAFANKAKPEFMGD